MAFRQTVYISKMSSGKKPRRISSEFVLEIEVGGGKIEHRGNSGCCMFVVCSL